MPAQPDGDGDMSCRVALLTLHGKEQAIAPVLAELDWQVQVTRDFNTDLLGTFSRDVARTLDARACARRKAELAIELTGLDKGLGSEGSFGGGPFPGMLPWNQEILVLIDRTRDLELVAHAQGPAANRSTVCASTDEVQAFAEHFEAGQRFVIRPDHDAHPDFLRGIAAGDALLSATHAMLAKSSSGQVFVELDLRAHYSPPRLRRIAEAAANLVAKWRSHCPQCQSPGFWVEQVEKGLPCEACGTATERIKTRIHVCPACRFSRHDPATGLASQGECPYCNP